MKRRVLIPVTCTLLVVVACGTSSRVKNLKKEAPQVSISLPGEKDIAEDFVFDVKPKSDTLEIVDFEGRKVTVWNAVKDENGDMIANDVLQAAVITARFRNVAERHGKVDLEFQVTVPRMMLEQDWQVRFYPDMYMLEDSTRLDMLILTGEQYRKSQQKGYQRYSAFLAGIVSDTTRFINLALLERFLERNIPQVYAFKHDSTYVSDERFSSCFGVTEKQAIEHYTNKIAIYYNNRKKSKMAAMYRRYVKAPYITEGVRLDTVFVNPQGDFVYNYIQTIQTRPGLRKVDIVLSGEIFQQDLLMYDIPRCEPLTFYISSLSAFTDNTVRYLTKIVERRAEANTSCRIEFAQAAWDIVPELGDNGREISRIRSNIRDVLMNEKYDLDSITISSFASPEGGYVYNKGLSSKRAYSVADYFGSYVHRIRDSLRREAGVMIVLGDNLQEQSMTSDWKGQDIRFVSRAGGENWDMLDELIRRDTVLTDSDKERYFSLQSVSDYDTREVRMREMASYEHIRNNLYPKLRSVDFDFHLHRKGMVKDTLHSTELDSTYMAGVQAIRDRDYDAACIFLAPYQDFNTAVAYLAADRNMSALEILEPMERTGVINYMLAILYSRLGDERQAVQCYVHSCAQDRTYVSRGNLDPEVSYLIKKYGLNKEDDFEF